MTSLLLEDVVLDRDDLVVFGRHVPGMRSVTQLIVTSLVMQCGVADASDRRCECRVAANDVDAWRLSIA